MNIEAGSWSDWVQAVGAAVALGIAVWAHLQQTKLQKQQTKLQEAAIKQSLFEKRYQVYLRLREFLADVVREGNVDDQQRTKRMLRETKEHEFLYPAHVGSFIDKVFQEAMRCRTLRMTNREPEAEEILQ